MNHVLKRMPVLCLCLDLIEKRSYHGTYSMAFLTHSLSGLAQKILFLSVLKLREEGKKFRYDCDSRSWA